MISRPMVRPFVLSSLSLSLSLSFQIPAENYEYKEKLLRITLIGWGARIIYLLRGGGRVRQDGEIDTEWIAKCTNSYAIGAFPL